MKLRRLSTARPRASTRKLAALTRYDAAQDPAVQKAVRSDPRRRAQARRRGGAANTRRSSTASRRSASSPSSRAKLRSTRIPARAGARRCAPRTQRDQGVPRAAAAEVLGLHRRRRHAPRPAGDAARPRRPVRARRQGGLSVVGADERVPAKVAGVRELVMVRARSPNPLVLAAAALAGVDRVHRHRRRAGDRRAGLRHEDRSRASTRSSARATPTSPRPSARCSARSASTWSPAPPRSWSSPTARRHADWVAMDLFSQAEHDESAQAILLSPDEGYLDAVAASHRQAAADGDAKARRDRGVARRRAAR